MFSLLIPWAPSTPDRQLIFDWVLARWRCQFPDAQVITDAGSDATLGKPMNRAQARNAAFEFARHDVLVVADADTVLATRGQLAGALGHVRRHPRSWVLPFTTYLNLLPEHTERYLGCPPAGVVPPPAEVEHRLDDAVCGVLVVTREAWETVGGYDERFGTVWGGEDRAFQYALDCLWASHTRIDGLAMHLWHTRSPGADFKDPGWPRNQRLEARYRRAAHDPRAMRALIRERSTT